jgi:hypothetical protein
VIRLRPRAARLSQQNRSRVPYPALRPQSTGKSRRNWNFAAKDFLLATAFLTARHFELVVFEVADKQSGEARNVVLSEAHIRRLILEAPKESEEFGLFVEVAAVTGARPSQIAVKLGIARSPISQARATYGAFRIIGRRFPPPLVVTNRGAAEKKKATNLVAFSVRL